MTNEDVYAAYLECLGLFKNILPKNAVNILTNHIVLLKVCVGF